MTASARFCSRYVMLYRIRQNVGRVHMIDARDSDNPLVQQITAKGLDLNNGMVVQWEAASITDPMRCTCWPWLGSEDGIFSKIKPVDLFRQKLAKFIYPAMVAGRKLTLKLLGRPPIENV